MIWLWIYAAGIFPAMLGAAYHQARSGSPRWITGQVAVIAGFMWPIFLAFAPLFAAIDYAAKLGERSRRDSQGNRIEVES